MLDVRWSLLWLLLGLHGFWLHTLHRPCFLLLLLLLFLCLATLDWECELLVIVEPLGSPRRWGLVIDTLQLVDTVVLSQSLVSPIGLEDAGDM